MPTTDNEMLETLSSVLLRGPEANVVNLSKRKNVVDIDWSPEMVSNDGCIREDPSGRITNTNKIFADLQVR
jgi:hypothetical protein